MEILIIGGALVALMIYVSTRIKRSAAQAFEAETIETDEFALVKPEGFLSPFNENSEFAFEAYTKEFGEAEGTERLRQATADLRVIADGNFAALCGDARKTVDKILREETLESPEGQKAFLLQGEKSENGAKTVIYRKIVAGEQAIYDLRATVLSDARDAFAARIDKLIQSFRVK